MTLAEAKRIVTHAAYAWANGSTESAQILEAIQIVLHDGEVNHHTGMSDDPRASFTADGTCRMD